MKCLIRCAWAVLILAAAGCAHVPIDHAADDERALRAVADAVEIGIAGVAAKLHAAADALGDGDFAGPKARRILQDLCDENRAIAIDCAAIDADGTMETLAPPSFRAFEGKSVADQEQVARVKTTKEPALSQIFIAVEGMPSIDFEWPVLSAKGAFLGSVSLLINPKSFLRAIVKAQTPQSIYDGWIAQPDGKILSAPNANIIGTNFFDNPYNNQSPSLLLLGRRVQAEERGQGVYRVAGAGQADPISRRVFWTTIDVYGTKWRIALVEKL